MAAVDQSAASKSMSSGAPIEVGQFHRLASSKSECASAFAPQPMYHQPTHQGVEFEDYFRGPRNVYHHSKWPYFLRLHGSVLPKMILPLSLIALWTTLITSISILIRSIAMENVLLTVTGFVVGLALSFRSSTAYERYSEGRRYWASLSLASRCLARLIWVHVKERHDESPELGKEDLLAKLAVLQLINAFAVALKHRLRFEPSVEYPDLAPLIRNVHTLAADADQVALRPRKISSLKSLGQYLGLPMAQSNPRKLIKRSKDNLGNAPLEIITYIASYIEDAFQNKTLAPPPHQTQAMLYLNQLTDVLTGCERIVNTPLPIAYSISISQITWAYVLVLPFQLVEYLRWVTIPGVVIAGYIILGLAKIGRELEDPFGEDVNDLPLDAFCHEIADDIDALTSRPAPLNRASWTRDEGCKVLWPMSQMEFQAWEQHSVADIRAALRAKAASRDVKENRETITDQSEALTSC